MTAWADEQIDTFEPVHGALTVTRIFYPTTTCATCGDAFERDAAAMSHDGVEFGCVTCSTRR